MFGELGKNVSPRWDLNPRPLLTIESPVAQWLEHPTRSQRVVGSNPILGSDFFRVLQTFTLNLQGKTVIHSFKILYTCTIELSVFLPTFREILSSW